MLTKFAVFWTVLGHNVIRFLWVSAKFGSCTVVSVNETLEAKMCTFTLESTHFIFNKCPIYTHEGASAKFSANLQETDYSAQRKTEAGVSQEDTKTIRMGMCYSADRRWKDWGRRVCLGESVDVWFVSYRRLSPQFQFLCLLHPTVYQSASTLICHPLKWEVQLRQSLNLSLILS